MALIRLPGYSQSPCGNFALISTVPYVNANPIDVILPLTIGGRISAPEACLMHASADEVHLDDNKKLFYQGY